MRVGVGNMKKGSMGKGSIEMEAGGMGKGRHGEGEHGDGRHRDGEMGMEGGMEKCQGHAGPGGLDVSSLEIHCGPMQVTISHLSSMRV